MTARQWSSVLASLSKKGWYKHDDDKEFKGVFGYIKLGATPDCF